MKRFMSVILALVVVSAVGASFANGVFASFLDTEISTDNYMCAGKRDLELTGGPIVVTHAMPSKNYSEEFTLINTGSLDGVVKLHIPGEDGSLQYNSTVSWEGIECLEDGKVNDLVYYGTTNDYDTGTPVGPGTASSEAEFVAEEGGQVGQIQVDGVGTDAGSDDGPDAYLMSRHIDVVIWFDTNGDGDLDDPEDLILGDPTRTNPVKLHDIVCQKITIGEIPGRMADGNGPGGGLGLIL